MKLKELKEEIENATEIDCELYEVIADIRNLLFDYDAEHEDRLFEDLEYRFVDSETVFDSLRNAEDLHDVGNILMYIDDFDNDYYLDDDVYGYCTYSAEDIVRWAHEIIARIDREIGGDTDANK